MTKTKNHSTSWCRSPFLESHSCCTEHTYHMSEHQSREPRVDQSSTKDLRHRTSPWPVNVQVCGWQLDSYALWFSPLGFSFYTVLHTVYAAFLSPLLTSCLNNYFYPMLVSIAANGFTSHIVQGKPVAATMVFISFCLPSKFWKHEMLPLLSSSYRINWVHAGWTKADGSHLPRRCLKARCSHKWI